MDLLSSGFLKLAKGGLLPKLVKELKAARNDRRKKIDKIANVFGDPYLLAENYVEPKCQQFNPADDDDEGASVVREPIFTRLSAFFESKDRDHQLFILADAGMGKSSVLMMVSLTHICSFWPKGYDCVLLKLGKSTLTDIEKIESKRNTILLLDALDEDPLAWENITVRIGKLLSASKNFKKVVITCRTQFFSGGSDPFENRGKLEVAGYRCPVLYLSLFDEPQINEFCLRKFEGDRQKVRKAQGALLNMKSLKCRPMLLAHIEDILDSEQKKWNVYSVYDALLTSWLNREYTKLSEVRDDAPSANALRKVCSAYATKLFEENTKALSSKEFDDFVRRYSSASTLKKLDIGGRSLINKNSDGEYRFSHLTIQEFLLVESILKGDLGIHPKNVRATDQMIEFIYAFLEDVEIIDRKKYSLRMLDFSNVSLEKHDFSGVGFEAANLVGLYAKEAVFVGSNLKYSDLSNSDIRHSDFSCAELYGSKFNRANMEGITLVQLLVQTASFVNARMVDASFLDMSFEYCDLSGSEIDGASFSNVTFTQCKFEKSSFVKARFRNVKFEDCVFLESDFSDSYGGGIEIISSEFDKVDFSSVEFDELKLDRVEFKESIANDDTCLNVVESDKEYKGRLFQRKTEILA